MKKVNVVQTSKKNMSIPIETFNRTQKEVNEVYEKTQHWGRIDFVKKIVQMQHDIDDLTSCINVYRKDMNKAIKILGGNKC